MGKRTTRLTLHGLRNCVMLCFTLLLTCNLAVAQTTTVKGTVISAKDNLPIIGATVMVEDSTVGISTDFEGNFELRNVPTEGTLVFSYVGMTTAKEAVEANKTYNITLQEDTKVIEDVVVVGYGTMRKKEVTGAVSRVESEALSKINTSDVGSALQGQIAGVNVQFTSGQPGETANIQIRGISSITGGNNPLYVVDGIPYNGDPGLSPAEIESIDVLKDAASAAIYGTRGAAGVILITTKKGKEGTPMKVTLDANYGIQTISSRLYNMNTPEALGAQYVNNMQNVINSTANQGMGNVLEFGSNSNMADYIEQDNQPITNVALTVSGGGKGSTYSVVGNYFNQEGVIINSGYERFNIRANTQFKKNKWTFTANMTTSISEKETPAGGMYNGVYTYDPTTTFFDPTLDEYIYPCDINQGSAMSQMENMVSMVSKFKETNITQSNGFNGAFGIDYEILKGLTFGTRLGVGYYSSFNENIMPVYSVVDINGVPLALSADEASFIKDSYTKNNSLTWENMLNYKHDFGKHSIAATAVFSMERYARRSFKAERDGLIDNSIINLGSASGSNIIVDTASPDRVTTMIGMLGRLQYSYDSRYMMSASLRKDGSSRFGSDNRWGYFPSASVGWNISEESFFEPYQDVVNSLKLRASYGTTGNQNFDDYSYSVSMSTNYDYAFGNGDGTTSQVLGSSQTSYANANVGWETTIQSNLGIDASFFDSRLSFTGDIYKSNKKDMLMSLAVPMVAGTGSGGDVTMNVGDMENKGIELALGWRDRIGKVNYNVSTTYSRNVNTVTKMAGTNKQLCIGTMSAGAGKRNVTYLKEGYEAGLFYLFPTNGIVDTDKELEEYQKLDDMAALGDLIYVDSNEDGVIDDNDRVNSGSGAPEAELGLNLGLDWKGFDFSMSWYASIGNEVMNGSKATAYTEGIHRDLLYSWSIYNQSSTIVARTTTGNISYNFACDADYWMEDGSFARLRNIVLGYTIPKKCLSKVGISKLRVYVAADNIWTLTNYTGYNPGVGGNGLSSRGLDNGTYPVTGQVRGGIQLDF